ncbi:MAG: glyoxylate/hydroxypyruvate reductase A [Asticcacaulis sp.]
MAEPTPIVFTGRIDAEETALWLKALRIALPQARIVTPDEAVPETVEVVIAANPDPAELRRFPRLKWVHSVWAGVERLMAELPEVLPVVRLIDPELSRVMGEAVLTFALYLQRDVPAYARQQRQQLWEQRPYRAPQEMTVGVLGLGEMGRAAAGRLGEAGFGITGWSRTPCAMAFETFHGDAGLETVLRRSDIVVCLLPLTPGTRGLLDAQRLSWMREGAALINFGRGAIVDAEALYQALDTHLSHAVLDVFATEPLPESSPLWTHEKVTVLPHISAPTNVETAAAIVAGNIRDWIATGRMPEAVDRQRGY